MKKIPKHGAAKRAKIYHLLAEMIGNRPQFIKNGNRLDEIRWYICPMLSASTLSEDLSDEFPEFFLFKPKTLLEYNGNSYSWFDRAPDYAKTTRRIHFKWYSHPDTPSLVEANDARITALLFAEQIAKSNAKRYLKGIIKVADTKHRGRTYEKICVTK